MLAKKESEEFKDSISKALKRKQTIVLLAHSSISYSGRAEATLDYGDRIIIIKPDKTFLVHQPTGSNAVIYMKPGSQVEISEEDGELILQSSNMTLHELVEVRIKKIISFSSASLSDAERVQLFGTEKDMSDYIYNNPDIISKDFKPVSREEQTKHGYIDVFGHDKNDNLIVIECKRTKAGPGAPQQLRRYIERLSKSKGISPDKIRGIVAAPNITKNAEHMLKELGYKFKKIDPPAYLKRKKESQHRLERFN